MPTFVNRILAVAAAAAALLFAAPTAPAAPKKMIWGQAQVNGVSEFPTYTDLGVDLLALGVAWNTVAPTAPTAPTDPNDPAYRWPADLDLAAAEGARTGIGLVILVMYTPGWANGERSTLSPPTDPDAYAQFLEALARRYPTVRHFQVWGEPNLADKYAITPGPVRDYYATRGNAKGALRPLTARQRRELQGYARLVDATYGRLKALNRENMVIGGNTTTSGSIDPFNWARSMRLPNGKPPRMDLWGHNPFGTRGPDLRKSQLIAGTADMSDLDVFAPWVRKYLSRGGRNRRLKLFATEYTAPTDDPGFEFPYHVTRALQASWLRAAWKITASENLYGLGWIALRDSRREDGATSQIGLLDLGGAKKPSYDVFKRLR